MFYDDDGDPAERRINLLCAYRGGCEFPEILTLPDHSSNTTENP